MTTAAITRHRRLMVQVSLINTGRARFQPRNVVAVNWLEANGYAQREVRMEEDGNFTVRWRS